MKRPLLLLILLLAVTLAPAQQFTTLTQYMLNKAYLNPAYTGEGELYNVTVLHRTQWAGYTDYEGNPVAPQMQLLSAFANIDKTGHSIGLLTTRDKIGFLTSVQAEVSYAYKIRLTTASALSVGMRAGIDSRTIDFSKYVIRHADDPLIPQEKQTETRPDISLGLWYDHEKYYLGLSAKSVTGNNYNTPGFATTSAYVATAGYHLPLSKDLIVTPSFQVIASEGDEVALDISALADYGSVLFGGLSYRHEEAVAAIAGISFLETKLRLSYSFDYVTNNKRTTASTSHEIMLRYKTGEWKQKKTGGGRLKRSKVRKPTKPIMIVRDKDKDGIADDQDKCIDVPGLKEFDGCPDKDSDGVPDPEDQCPDVSGLPSFNGCPDTDEDGITDREDDCPEVPGKAEDKGCPASLTQETLAHIIFETGKGTLVESSYPYLDQVVAILKEYDKTNVIIEGHTDSEGEDSYNLVLSQQRAEAIQHYFIEKGIEAARLSVSGLGETKPIDTNDTTEGRRRNRRVEIHFVE